MSGLLNGLSVWITGVIDTSGYLGIAFLIFLENIFPPIPSELVLPLTGFLVSEGRFSFTLVMTATVVGSVLSSLVWWGVGKLYGQERVYRLVGRYGKWFLLRTSDIEKAERFFAKHGGKAVFFGRFVPGIRSVISLPAGLADMPVLRFVIFTALGSGLWNALLVGVGMVLQSRWRDLLGYLDTFEYAAYAAIALLVLWFFISRLWARVDKADDTRDRRERRDRG